MKPQERNWGFKWYRGKLGKGKRSEGGQGDGKGDGKKK